MIGAWALGALLTAAPLQVATQVECSGPAERCQAVAAALGAAVKAEGLTPRADAGCGEGTWAPGCFVLRAKAEAVTVFFELRDASGPRLISSTDVAEYRAKYRTQDALILGAFLTIVAAPLAYELRTPTRREDETRAWTLMARRLLRHGARGGRTYFGAQEVRGRRWTVAMATPDIRRVPIVEPDAAIVESSYAPVAPGSDEAKQGSYSAGLLLSAVAQALESTDALTVADGSLRLVAIHDAHGHFGARLMVRDNPALSDHRAFMSALRGAIFLTSAFPLPGYTRIELPLTVRRANKK